MKTLRCTTTHPECRVLKVREPPVRAKAHFSTTAGSRLTKTARHMLSCTSLREESVERVISFTDCTVTGHLALKTSETCRRPELKLTGALRLNGGHAELSVAKFADHLHEAGPKTDMAVSATDSCSWLAFSADMVAQCCEA